MERSAAREDHPLCMGICHSKVTTSQTLGTSTLTVDDLRASSHLFKLFAGPDATVQGALLDLCGELPKQQADRRQYWGAASL